MPFGSSRVPHKQVVVDVIVAFSLAWLACPSQNIHAQTVAVPEPAASAAAPSERARHEAELVFDMIRLQADRPRRNALAGKVEKNGVTVQVRSITRPPARQAEPEAADIAQVAVRSVPEPTPPAAVANASVARDSVANAASPAAQESVAGSNDPETLTKLTPSAAGRFKDPDPAPATNEPGPKLIALASPAPNFQPQWLQSLRKGTVRIRFMVQPDGSVFQAEIVGSSSAHLNQAALDAVSRWRFEPIARPEPGLAELSFDLDAD